MISLTDLHGREIYLNADMIERVESNPDTHVVMTDAHHYYVTESPSEVAERIMRYRRECINAYPTDKNEPDNPASE